MKVEFLETATTTPNIDKREYTLDLVYVQYNGGEYTPAVETMEEWCFIVDSEGTLLHYNYDCGTDVVVPATVNGTAVKAIAGGAFNDKSMSFVEGASDSKIIVFDNEDFQKYLNAINKTVDSSTNQVDIDGTTYKVYMYDDDNISDAIYASPRDLITAYGTNAGYKLTDSDGTITVEASTTDPNFYVFGVPYGYICNTQEICEKVKKYIRDNDPASPGDDLTYSEYVGYDSVDAINSMPFSPFSTNHYLSKETDLDAKVFINFMYGGKFSETEEGYLTSSSTLNTLDFSNAIYLEEVAYLGVYVLTVDKLVMPPNIEFINVAAFAGNHIGNLVFPENSKLKAIGLGAFQTSQISSIEIPASVKSIGSGAFGSCGITNLTFETGSQLIAIYLDRESFGAFKGNNLTQVRMPSTLKYMATNTFSDNPNLTQITLTSPTDIDGWPNGGTVNGATVTYER